TASNQETPNEQGESKYDALDGVEVTDIDSNARQQYSIPASVHGAVVSSVDESSNAAEAGVRQGDVLQEINHQPVKTADDAVRLSNNAKGNRVLLKLWRPSEQGQGGSFYITVDNTKKSK